jgi:hypothetical protein
MVEAAGVGSDSGVENKQVVENKAGTKRRKRSIQPI